MVLILGGGPAGCAAALALRAAGIEPVLVAEAGTYENDRIGESIPPDARLLFDRLGVLRAFEQEAHEACLGSCSCWGSDTLGYNDFLFNPNGSGFHLDRRRFDIFLARQALQAGAHVLTRGRFLSARPVREANRISGYVVELETAAGAMRVAARFVIDATGGAAHFARGQGATRIERDRFFCATGYFHLNEGTEFPHLTLLEAVRDGWWYAARLPDRRVAVALACDGDSVRTGALHESDHWLARLGRSVHLREALRDCFFIPGSLRVCPVPCFVLDRVTGERWLAAGDAASSFDPLSSQGIHKALDNGLDAAEAVRAVLDDGGADALARYSSRVRESFDAHLAQRELFYQREQRWPHSDFWKRRQSV